MKIEQIARLVDRHLERLLKLRKMAEGDLLARVNVRIEMLGEQWDSFEAENA